MHTSLTQEFLSLNREQQKAVSHKEGPMLVLAGAGSGKTKVATLRIALLIESGIEPNAILGLTFTNKAAKEMQERVTTYSKRAVLVCTFHSLGARMLRESIHHLGYTRDFVIYDEDDSEKLISESLRELGVSKQFDLKAAKACISSIKNGMKERLIEESEGLLVYKKYLEKLKLCNAVDFDDLLRLPVELLRSSKDILEHYQNRWTHLLVDEYQDTNGSQYAFVKLLAGKRCNLFVVGDPDQSIYSWRGANIRNIMGFEQDFHGAQIVRLEQNYRSTNTILRAANAIIKNNEGRYEKQLWSALGDGEKIRLFVAKTEREEALFVAEAVAKKMEKKECPLHQMCILYRTNVQSRILEDQFVRNKIPYRIVGGISFYQRKEIKDIISILRLVDNARDQVSFLRAINLPKRGFGEVSIQKIIDAATEQECSCYDFMDKVAQEKSFSSLAFTVSAKQKEGWLQFTQTISSLRELAKTASIETVVRACIFQTQYEKVLEEDPETHAERLENLQEFVAKAEEWGYDRKAKDEEVSISRFLEEISLVSALDQSSQNEDCITLMTLHNGKGLEFHSTFLVGIEEDIIPHINSRDDPSACEEERRLFYVGITRAKKELFLSYACSRTLWGATRRMASSRFLREIPKELLQSLSATKQPIPPFIPVSPKPRESTQKALVTGTSGELVFHPEFGIGTIVSTSNSSLGPILEIRFSKDNKTRSLAARHAPLSKLDA